MKAVVTTSKKNYEAYLNIHNLNNKEAKWVSILKDIQDCEFSSVDFIAGFENVTDYVIKKIKLIDEN